MQNLTPMYRPKRYDPNRDPAQYDPIKVVGFDVGDTVIMTEKQDKDQINWGGNDDPNRKVIVNKPYKVQAVEVHSWHTKVWLERVTGVFNAVNFKRV